MNGMVSERLVLRCVSPLVNCPYRSVGKFRVYLVEKDEHETHLAVSYS